MGLESAWGNLILRLQGIAQQQRSACVLRMNIVIDDHGNPIMWTPPEVIKLEPQNKVKEFLCEMIVGLTGK